MLILLRQNQIDLAVNCRGTYCLIQKAGGSIIIISLYDFCTRKSRPRSEDTAAAFLTNDHYLCIMVWLLKENDLFLRPNK